MLGRECRSRGERLISGAPTSGGGGWRVENRLEDVSAAPGAGVLGAWPSARRWHGKYSRPVTWRAAGGAAGGQDRPDAHVGRAHDARHADGQPAGEVGFQGKRLELQRQAGSRWVRVRAARLVRKASFRWGAFNYQASFRIPTARADAPRLPTRPSAAPCFLPGASPTWRSRTTTGASRPP